MSREKTANSGIFPTFVFAPLSLIALFWAFFSVPGTARTAPSPPHTDVLDVHNLPLGDGKAADAPRRGYVMSCTSSFGGGGAQVAGPWIHGDHWDLTQKLSVQGRVAWPQAEFHIQAQGGGRTISRILQGNGLPVDTPTGNFPIGRDDPAFQIDRNPNTIVAQDISVIMPLNPEVAQTASCVPMGMIGAALNGVAIFNALDAGGRDAVAHEVEDLCSGHPQIQGQYHYHGPSACLPNQTANENLIGYAADGFGIFSMYDGSGREITDADLDECHGRTSEILWESSRSIMYHYVLTREYPYTVGCFRGTPVHMGRPGGGRGMGPPNGPPRGGFPGGGPPPFGD